MGILGGFLGVSLMLIFAVGDIYWFVLAWQLGSFWMFLAGITPPFLIVASFTGAYALFFGTPAWVLSWFA